jgi:hypothetical protein
MNSKSILDSRIQELESNTKKQKNQFEIQENASRRLVEEVMMSKGEFECGAVKDRIKLDELSGVLGELKSLFILVYTFIYV